MLKFVNTFISSNCLDLYHIKEMARNKQYNEQEVIEKAIFILAQWVSKYLGTYVGKGDGHQSIFYLCKFWKQTWRFRRKLEML
jgi:hypothetical protein